jgi:hypothetical protein
VAQLFSLGITMSASQVITEARARIIWGEAPNSVRQFLISNSISSTDADSIIEGFILEKNAGLRRDGIREILSGTVLLGASGGVLLWILLVAGLQDTIVLFGRGGIILACIGSYGAWRLVRGVILLAGSATRRKSKKPAADNPQVKEFSTGSADLNQTTNVENENYSILGLAPPCSLDEVKAAYRQCMKEYHPDRFTNEKPEFRQWAEERTKAINAAYERLLEEFGSTKQESLDT